MPLQILYKKLDQVKSGTDKRIIRFLETLNALPGLQVTGTEFICNKNQTFFIIEREDLNEEAGIFFILRCIDKRYFINGNWRLSMQVTDTEPTLYIDSISKTNKLDRKILYILENIEPNENILKELETLTQNMNAHYYHTNFMNGFKLDRSTFNTIDPIALTREEKIKEILK